MKKLTINQIILLLDIHRGTNTQHSIGTQLNDLDKLRKLDLIDLTTSKINILDMNLSRKGLDLITLIQTNINNLLKA